MIVLFNDPEIDRISCCVARSVAQKECRVSTHLRSAWKAALDESCDCRSRTQALGLDHPLAWSPGRRVRRTGIHLHKRDTFTVTNLWLTFQTTRCFIRIHSISQDQPNAGTR